MKQRDLVSLHDIISAFELIASFLHGVEREAFDHSALIQSGVVRQIEIIGEAAKRLSDELRLQYTDKADGGDEGCSDPCIRQHRSG